MTERSTTGGPLADGRNASLLPGIARWLLFTSGLHAPKVKGLPARISVYTTEGKDSQ